MLIIISNVPTNNLKLRVEQTPQTIVGPDKKSNWISPLSNFYADSNFDHEAESCSNKNDNYSTGPRFQFSGPISNPAEIF